MSFENLLGQQKAVFLLKKYAALAPGALIFAGPDGVGKKAAALELARDLNCDVGVDSPSDCACRSCETARAAVHPAILLVDENYQTEVVGKETQEISIDTVRAVQKALSLKLSHGRRAVVIVDSAHKLSPQAANSFLKTLEEPSTSSTLILVCRSKRELPRTVVSRCQAVAFAPLSDGDVAALLRRLLPSAVPVEQIAARSAGSVSRAMRMAEKAEYYDSLERKFRELDLADFKTADIGEFLDWLTASVRGDFIAAPAQNIDIVDAIHRARFAAASGVNKNMILARLHCEIYG